MIIEATAKQHELHLKAAGVADALDRRRWQDEQLAVGSRVESALQMLGYGQDVRAFRLAALVPWLEHDEADAGVGEVGKIVEYGLSGNRDDSVDPGRIEGDLGGAIECRCRSPNRRPVG